jgi:hypothetical protein
LKKDFLYTSCDHLNLTIQIRQQLVFDNDDDGGGHNTGNFTLLFCKESKYLFLEKN